MTNLYDIYLEKKSKDEKKILLFKSGNFYYILGEDAKLINKELSLKLTKFSNNSDKCGFPISEFQKYTKFISLLGYEYEIVLGNKDQVLEDIKVIDFTTLNGDEAINKLKEYQKLLLEI